MKRKILCLLLMGIVSSCFLKQNSKKVFYSYNPKANETTLTISPIGNIHIPGKWKRTGYDEKMKSYLFIDDEYNRIAIAKNRQADFSFFRPNISEEMFVLEYFTWETRRSANPTFQMKKLPHFEGDNYLFWTAKGKNIEAIYLYGAKNKTAYSLAIYSENWDFDENLAFLKKLFDDN